MVPLARSNKESCGEELGPTDGRNKPLVKNQFRMDLRGPSIQGSGSPLDTHCSETHPPVTILVGDYVNID